MHVTSCYLVGLIYKHAHVNLIPATVSNELASYMIINMSISFAWKILIFNTKVSENLVSLNAMYKFVYKTLYEFASNYFPSIDKAQIEMYR